MGAYVECTEFTGESNELPPDAYHANTSLASPT